MQGEGIQDPAMVEVTLKERHLLADFKMKSRADDGLGVRHNGHYVGRWMETW